MNRNGKIAAIAVVAILAIAAAGAFVFLNDDEEPNTYKIAVVKHNFEPLFIADSLGYFAQEGVKVELVSVSSGNDAMTALSTGNVDLAGFGSDPFLKLIDDYGEKYKYVGRWMLDEGLKGAAKQDCPYSFNGDNDSLIGAKIGVNTKVSYYSLLLEYLEKTDQEYVKQTDINVKDTNKVNIYHFDNSALSGALTGGSVDIIIAGATNINVVEKDPTKYKYIEATGGYKGYMSVGLFADMDKASSAGDDYKKILKAIDRACDYMNNSETKSEAVKICKERLNIKDDNVMQKYIDLAQWGVELNTKDKDSIESSFEYIVIDNPNKYVKNLKGKATIDINAYFCTDYLPADA